MSAADKLYDGFASSDISAILSALHPEFLGTVSTGMPCGVGGSHRGPEAMMRDCWGTVFASYAIAPRADEIVPCADGRVLVRGRYVGAERSTGRTVDAVFTHVLTLRDGLIIALDQVTDTASW